MSRNTSKTTTPAPTKREAIISTAKALAPVIAVNALAIGALVLVNKKLNEDK